MNGSPSSSAADAPSFLGPTPPDRVDMTFGDHLRSALEVFTTRPLDSEELSQFKMFVQAVDAEVRQKMAEGGGAGGGADDAEGAGDPNATSEYGSGSGSPRQEGPTSDYGAQ